MTERLRTIRAVGAWVILVYLGLLELFSLPPLVAAMVGGLGTTMEVRQDVVPTLPLVALPLAAVLITGVVKPPSYGARPIALIAFIEYGALFLWNLLVLGALTFNLGFLAARQQLDEIEVLPSVLLLGFAGMAAMSAAAGIACWQVYVGLDGLADEIADLQEQIEELDRQDAVEGAEVAGTGPAGPLWTRPSE